MEYSDLGGRRRRLGGCFSPTGGAWVSPGPGPISWSRRVVRSTSCRRIDEGQTIIELSIGMFLEIEAMDHHPISA